MRRQRLGELPPDLARTYRAGELRPGVTPRARAGAPGSASGAAPGGSLPGAAGAGVVRVNVAPFTFTTKAAGSSIYLPANANRSYLVLQNLSAAELWLQFSAASGINNGFKILAGVWAEWFYVIPTGSVSVYGGAPGLSFTLAEG